MKTEQEKLWTKEYRRLLRMVMGKRFVTDPRFGVVDFDGVLNLVRLDFLPVSFDQLQDELEEL